MTNSHKPLSVLVVLGLVEASIIVQAGYLCWRQYDLHQALSAQIEQQQPAIEKAGRVRAQLESLAVQTARLAQTGNQHAIQFVEALKEQGITIRSPDSPRSGSN